MKEKSLYEQWVSWSEARDLTRTQAEFAKFLLNDKGELRNHLLKTGVLTEVFVSVRRFLKSKQVEK